MVSVAFLWWVITGMCLQQCSVTTLCHKIWITNHKVQFIALRLILLPFLDKCSNFPSRGQCSCRLCINSSSLPLFHELRTHSLIFQSIKILPDFFFFWDQVICSPGWPWISYGAEDDFELLILLSLPFGCWDYGWKWDNSSTFGAGDWTQAFMHARNTYPGELQSQLLTF